jgi:hypothetical protein
VRLFEEEVVNRWYSAFAAAGALAASYFVAASPVAEANHSWGNYHWARTGSSFTLQLGDNVTSEWDHALKVASSCESVGSLCDGRRDWSDSAILDTAVVAGADKTCRRGTTGRVEACNARYGSNGWLAIAQIWASGSHITKGVVKMNDSYFSTSTYNRSYWRHFVMCQEIGHTFGLGHQDEGFGPPNLGSCMDYTNDPTGTTTGYVQNNEAPNQHDYDQLVTIYGGHRDSTTTVGDSTASTPGRGMSEEAGNGPPDWGRPVRSDNEGRAILYRKDFGGDRHLITWVRWTHPRDHAARP